MKDIVAVLFITLTLVFLPLAKAQTVSDDLLSISSQQVSQETNSDEAAREMTAKAINQTAREQVIEMIGDSKYQKNQKLVENKIIKESAKFIPFVSPGPVMSAETGFKMTVELKVSENSLRNMVLSAGLLADSESPGTVLSLLTITDKASHQSFNWWNRSPEQSKGLSMQIHEQWTQALSTALAAKGFKLAQPKEIPTGSDEKTLLNLSGPQLVVRGEIRFLQPVGDKAGTFAMKASVFQVKDNRLVTDAIRSESVLPTEAGLFKSKSKELMSQTAGELATDVMTAWQKGLIGSSIVDFVVRGALSPKQLGDFKVELMRSLRDLKSFKERRFAAAQVTFEGAYAGDPKKLETRLHSIQLPSFEVQLVSSAGSAPDLVKAVTLDVRPRR
jgi:hypothetical protein